MYIDVCVFICTFIFRFDEQNRAVDHFGEQVTHQLLFQYCFYYFIDQLLLLLLNYYYFTIYPHIQTLWRAGNPPTTGITTILLLNSQTTTIITTIITTELYVLATKHSAGQVTHILLLLLLLLQLLLLLLLRYYGSTHPKHFGEQLKKAGYKYSYNYLYMLLFIYNKAQRRYEMYMQYVDMKFSKVSTQLSLLYKITVELTFDSLTYESCLL